MVCRSVDLSLTIMNPVKMAQSIIPFGLWTRVGPRNAHWHHLANTIEPSACGGEAAFLSNYFDHLFPLVVGWVGLGWVSQLMGWVGSGHTKWTHGQFWFMVVSVKVVC